MSGQCTVCGKVLEGKEIVQLACVPAEWDEGLASQWVFACWKHSGVEEHADTEETERFHASSMEFYDPTSFVKGWKRHGR